MRKNTLLAVTVPAALVIASAIPTIALTHQARLDDRAELASNVQCKTTQTKDAITCEVNTGIGLVQATATAPAECPYRVGKTLDLNTTAKFLKDSRCSGPARTATLDAAKGARAVTATD